MSVLRIVDSITELNAGDADCISVRGSHGGLSSARYALAAKPLLSVFYDAGGGLDDAALDYLQSHGLAACVVARTSARIDEARSTLATGVASSINSAASVLGVQAVWTCRQTLISFQVLKKADNAHTHSFKKAFRPINMRFSSYFFNSD